MKNDFEWTGERLTTSKTNEIMTHHLHRYALAKLFVKDKVVLDIASGEGYGSALLSESAKHVYGVDIDEKVIRFAAEKYKKDNLSFLTGSASSIPVEDNSIDVLVTFETIEHHSKHEEMMLEVKRVLKSDGMMIISSPDKLVYSDMTGFNNPYHVKELYREEFKELLKTHFSNVKVYYQEVKYGSLIVPENNGGTGFSEINGTFDRLDFFSTIKLPVYNIAIVSDSELKIKDFPEHSFFDAGDILNEIKNKEQEIYNSKTYRLGRLMTFPIRLFRKSQ